MKKCIYCDTIYTDQEASCPLCGGTAFEPVSDSPKAPETFEELDFDQAFAAIKAEAEAEDDAVLGAAMAAAGGKAKARKSTREDLDPEEPEEDEASDAAVPKWMTALICLVLGAALLVGIAFIAYTMGLFDKKDRNPAPDDPALTLPFDNQDNQEQVDPGVTQQPEEGQQTAETDPAETEIQDPNETQQSDEPQPPEGVTGETDPEQQPEQPPEQEPEPDEPNEPTEPTEPDKPDEPVSLACTGIALNYTDVSLFSKGETFNIRTTLQPEGCTDPVTYSSADTNYVTVDENGKVTAVNGKGGGSVNVTVSCGDYKATCIVRLKFAEQEPSNTTETGENGFSLNLTDFTMQFKDEEVAVEVKGVNLAYDTVSWSIGNTDVATIRTNKNVCIVKAVGSGYTYLTATVNGNIQLKCIVRCAPKVSGEN